MKLKDNVLLEIKKNFSCREKLQKAHEREETTILRWLRENSPELTLYSSLQIIATYLQKEIDDLIVYEEHDHKPVV